MDLFSQRKGYLPVKAIQHESMDAELRNRLWSALDVCVWDRWIRPDRTGYQHQQGLEVENLIKLLWMHHLKLPTDTLSDERGSPPGLAVIRKHFFDVHWAEVYDFLEYVFSCDIKPWEGDLTHAVNFTLKGERSAYRLVESKIVEVTNEQEINAIKSGIGDTTSSCSEHLSQALALLSDRKQPDYRNSIKESISAVESICRAMSGEKGGTLGACLKIIESKTGLHPALKKAFSQLYGYTSDGGGIRHALSDDAKAPTSADAMFMLVACSAFTNYLVTIASEQGISLSIA